MRGYDFMIFSYMRISTQKEKQTTDRQRITLEQYAKENKFKFDEIIEERISGTIKAEHRPQFNILKQKLRENDILIITDIDRLGRNADDVIMEFKKLKSGFVVCFYRSGKSEDESTDKIEKSTDKVRINTDKLNFSQKKVIEFILDNGKVTNKDVQQLLGVKDSRALKILKELVEKDVVVKQGKLKGSYYTIKKYE